MIDSNCHSNMHQVTRRCHLKRIGFVKGFLHLHSISFADCAKLSGVLCFATIIRYIWHVCAYICCARMQTEYFTSSCCKSMNGQSQAKPSHFNWRIHMEIFLEFMSCWAFCYSLYSLYYVSVGLEIAEFLSFFGFNLRHPYVTAWRAFDKPQKLNGENAETDIPNGRCWRQRIKQEMFAICICTYTLTNYAYALHMAFCAYKLPFNVTNFCHLKLLKWIPISVAVVVATANAAAAVGACIRTLCYVQII